MPKNPLSTLRKNDEIFERDSAKSTRKRGNQKEYDHTKRWKDNLISVSYTHLTLPTKA